MISVGLEVMISVLYLVLNIVLVLIEIYILFVYY